MTVIALLIRLLVPAVIFVNGWTDAPNAIATVVGTGAMSFRKAAWMAAGCNFAGLVLAGLLFPAVAETVSGLVTFAEGEQALAALCGAMTAVVLWACAAWRFGLPTSESHALLAGLAGAALALGKTAELNAAAWGLALGGMLFSLPAGFGAGRLLRRVTSGMSRPHRWQKWSAALTALLHGAQDGQKFMALLLMAEGLGGRARAPLSPLLLTALCMAAGTALGGRPIVEKVGSELAVLSPADGLAADLGTGAVLALCSLLGLPVSTTHAKVAAVCGAGREPDLRPAAQMAGAWLLTFPCCGALAFLLTKLLT